MSPQSIAKVNLTLAGDVSGIGSWRVYLIVALEGFVSIAVEILALRQALPFIGSNIVITSSIIGAFLLSLSIGYYVGGLRSDGVLGKLTHNFLISQFLIVCGLSIYTLSILSNFASSDLVFLLLLLVCAVCPASFLLGQSIPLLSNFLSANNLPRFSGKILFLSTIGSFFGSVLTATLFMNFLGVSATISFISLLLTLLILMLSLNIISRPLLVSAGLTAFSFLLINNTNLEFPGNYLNENARRVVFPIEYENAYSTVSMSHFEGVNYLSINGNDSSSYNTNTNATEFWYSYIIEKYLAEKSGLNILVAGAGGFTIGINDYKNNYVYVDIDSELREVSEQKLLQRKINGKFVVRDVRGFLRDEELKYDVIISDVYNGKTLPASLVTLEYFGLIEDKLTKDGVVFVNTISAGDLSSTFSTSINNTLTSAYNCLALLTEHETVTEEHTNVLYFCRPRTHNIVFTDDRVNEFALLNQ